MVWQHSILGQGEALLKLQFLQVDNAGRDDRRLEHDFVLLPLVGVINSNERRNRLIAIAKTQILVIMI